MRGFSLAADKDLWAPQGIAVTCFMPDAVQTPMVDMQLGCAVQCLSRAQCRVRGLVEYEYTNTHARKHAYEHTCMHARIHDAIAGSRRRPWRSQATSLAWTK